MASALKTIVSKNKNRHNEIIDKKKYDLDLTYITPRIIAMGYPAEKLESMYRNDYNDVKEFLDQKHGDHYWVYNLCSEKDRNYDKRKFDDRVTCYPFDDHHPPVFRTIHPFCEDVVNYLKKDERNVAVVHCKAGKGRTGVMVCCYLLHIGASKNAEDVLKMYGEKRTADTKGVTIPSQRRYITYYDTIRRRSQEYKPVKLYLKDIVLDPMPNFSASSQYYIYFEVRQRGRKPYEYKLTPARKGDRNVSLSINPPLLLSEDTKFEFYYKAKYETHIFNANSKLQKWAKGEKAFHFWLNTFFVDMEIEGCLAHDLTGSNPIEASGSHVHHASGSSEDSSAEDVPLRASMASTNGGGHHHDMVGDSIGNNSTNSAIQKQVSTSDDYLLRQTDQGCQAPENVTHISSMGPLSSSSENNASTDSFSSATPESFRMRHVSMPQHSVRNSQPQCDMSHHQPHHLPLEGRSLSHGIHHNNHHATITSQTSMVASSSHLSKVHIPGKQLSLRLRKGQIDKAHKDKTAKTFPENFSVTLFLVKPPEDQSDTLIDYSLYTQAMMSSNMNNHSTITATGVTTGNPQPQAISSGERQFTITQVASGNASTSLNPLCSDQRQRSRPLTGESGASSSSATPSLKSMEQSSQDSSDDGGSEVADYIKVGSSNSTSDQNASSKQTKHLKMRSATNNRTAGTSTTTTQQQQPQSTWI